MAEHVVDPKVGYPGVGLCTCGGVLMYFFGAYWLSNPDLYLINGKQSICTSNIEGDVKIMA